MSDGAISLTSSRVSDLTSPNNLAPTASTLISTNDVDVDADVDGELKLSHLNLDCLVRVPFGSSDRSIQSMGSQIGPPVETFSAHELPERINRLPNGNARKPSVKLEECDLLQMTQYKCDIKERQDAKPHVVCRPFLRLFRR